MVTSERFAFRAAVYLILIRDEKLLLLRRAHTGWRDGDYTLPAGHLDGGESPREAMARETFEEIGIRLSPSDLQFAHVMHHTDSTEYIDFYFVAPVWQGEPKNLEPEKCDDLMWVGPQQLPPQILPNVKQALEAYRAGQHYSEFNWE